MVPEQMRIAKVVILVEGKGSAGCGIRLNLFFKDMAVYPVV